MGANGLYETPDVPKVFRWQFGGEEVFVLWHKTGYGGIEASDCAIVGDEALCPDWNFDNAGPYKAAEVIQHFSQIRTTFPNAEVVSAIFDDFLPVREPAAGRVHLPQL